MIWIWIAAALALSVFFCRGKKVNIYHYIWMLFPIEMYGVALFGATIKPYMFAGLLIFLDNLYRHRTITIPTSMIVISVMILVTDCLNGIIKESIMQHLMVIIVMFIAINYYIALDKEIAIDEIAHVWVSTLLGFGIIFIVASFVRQSVGFDYGVQTFSRTNAGLFLWQQNCQNFSVRLRGFTMDPNAVIATLIPGACMALHNLLQDRRVHIKNILAIAVYVYIVALTDSRTAIVCSLIMVLLIFIPQLKTGRVQSRIVFFITACIMISLIILLLTQIDIAEIMLQSYHDVFGARSSLTDKYGRFSIWIESIRTLVSNNGLLFGIGQNQIQYLSDLGKACHNTWLEWICGTGIFVGTGIVSWFVLVPIDFAGKIQETALNKISIVLAVYWSIWLCIASVDSIANITLFFLVYMFVMCERVRGKNESA